MIRYFGRFSTPGRPGYIPGTSKHKYRQDWIDFDAMSWEFDNRQANFGSVVVALEIGKSLQRLTDFAQRGTGIDYVIIETVKANVDSASAVILRYTLEGVLIISAQPDSRGGSIGTLSFSFKKMVNNLLYNPDVVKYNPDSRKYNDDVFKYNPDAMKYNPNVMK